MYKVKEEFEGMTVERMVVGFGQKVFKLSEMNGEEVAKWLKRGADIGEYFEEVKGSGGKSAAQVEKEAAEARFKARVGVLLGLGFKRVQDDFKHESGKMIPAKTVVSMPEDEFEAFTKEEMVEADKTPEPEGNKEPEKKPEPKKEEVKKPVKKVATKS